METRNKRAKMDCTTMDIGGAEFNVVLENVNQFETFQSKVVSIRNLPWCIKMSKKLRNNEHYLAIDLVLLDAHNDIDNTWVIVAKLDVQLLKSDWTAQPHSESIGPMVFNSKNKIAGSSSFIKWNTLTDSGFSINDTVKFEFKITASPVQDASIGDWMSIEDLDKCCDNSSSGRFRVEIKKMNESFGICSPEITFKGMPWRIVIVKGENLQILLINMSSTDGAEWSSQVYMACKLMSFSKAVEPIVRVMPEVRFDQISNKHFYNLISWNGLTDRSKGFIENGSFVIELQIKLDDPNHSIELKLPTCPKCSKSMINVNLALLECNHIVCVGCYGLLKVNCIFSLNIGFKAAECPECLKYGKVELVRLFNLPKQ